MNKMLQKGAVIAALACVILIALYMVSGVIDDRQKYRDTAVQSIEASYAGPQVLIGPVLVRPYVQTTEITETSDKGVKRTSVRKQELSATSFPRELDMRGSLLPSERRHGLYKVEVYELQGHLKGEFDVVDPKTEGSVVWGEPYLALSVTDVRGIIGTPRVMVNGVEETMLQGAPATTGWQPNLRIPLHGVSSMKGHLDFYLDLNLAGTETLSMAPVGDANRLELRSVWRSPLFAGQFLPRTRDVASDGFQAVWEVSSLASGTQAQLEANPVKPIDLMSVSLTTLLDPYSLSSRATKYGILFVVITFGGFFIFELIKQLPIHPVQYLLLGLGLAIFFLLLVSFSERVAFGTAYLLASAACIVLLTFYLSYVLRSTTRGLGFGAMLTSLYAAIYGLLISEDNALVLGSLMLFCLLSAVMFATREVDWYREASEGLQVSQDRTPTAPPPHPS
ncbi:inner membrane protein [Granulicella aggregans]|uniref:Inner membrane protein n=1 Tax=Granulicella aggregans TaxID=474949 RepID=A0A7W7ZF53_9BACT|nr:cell envelope integrity protein CreD [Granulicella aggregans]MBB5058764.1 inner membrane protein [Granulicella aggregans]